MFVSLKSLLETWFMFIMNRKAEQSHFNQSANTSLSSASCRKRWAYLESDLNLFL